MKNIRITDSLHKKLKNEARKKRVLLSGLTEQYILIGINKKKCTNNRQTVNLIEK